MSVDSTDLNIKTYSYGVRSRIELAGDCEIKFNAFLLDEVKQLGFSDVEIENISNPNLVTCVQSSLDDSIWEQYCAEKLYKYDLMLDILRQARSPVFESTAINYFSESPFYSEILSLTIRPHLMMRAHSFFDSYTLPIDTACVSKNNKRFTFSVLLKGAKAKDFQKLVKENQKKLLVLAQITCEQLAQKIDDTPILTQREIDVLSCIIKYPDCRKQLADKLGISVNTVNNHVINIKKALNAPNLGYAVSRAVELGLINLR